MSKLTWLSQEERWTDVQIQRFSGHKSIENLHRYIKVDAKQNLADMLQAEQRKAIDRAEKETLRKRDAKEAEKKAAE